MDHVFPEGMIAAIGREQRMRRRKAVRHVVEADGRRHQIVSLGPDGFVIEGGDGPGLRGFVDIVEGDTRIARRLVVCAWVRDGLVGYEYKHASPRRQPAADYVLPEVSGQLDPPRD